MNNPSNYFGDEMAGQWSQQEGRCLTQQDGISSRRNISSSIYLRN